MNNIQILCLLGEGAFAKVFLVKGCSGCRQTKDTKNCQCYFAMKVVNKRQIHKEDFVHYVKLERNILLEMNHPFLLKLNCSFQDKHNFYMMTNFAAGGSLWNVLSKQSGNRFSEKEILFYACEIICALEHLHLFGILYRDLKPENILVYYDGHIKLADFGFCKKKELAKPGSTPYRTFSIRGTAQYIAPEIYDSKGHQEMADWWALGITLYELATGQPPFELGHGEQRDMTKLMNDVKYEEIPRNPFFSDNFQSLLDGLMRKCPMKRLGSDKKGGVSRIKKQPFFRGVCWEKVVAKEMKPPVIPQ